MPRFQMIGRISSASTSDIRSTAITTVGIWRMILPMLPETKSSGAKAATEVMMAKVTGTAISRTPRMAASNGFMPRCRYS